MPLVAAKSGLEVVAIFDPAGTRRRGPGGKSSLRATTNLPDRSVTGDLNAKSVRRAITQSVQPPSCKDGSPAMRTPRPGWSVQRKGPRRAAPSDDAVFLTDREETVCPIPRPLLV